MKSRKKKKKKSKAPAVIFTIFCTFLFLYLGMAFYYTSHFYFGSYINGINYSGKTVKMVEESIAGEISKYCITLTGRNDVRETIFAEDFGYHYVADHQIPQLKESQNPFLWPLSYFNSEELSMEATTDYDREMLLEAFEGLSFFDPENSIEPADAKIEYQDGEFVIQEEELGCLVDREKLWDALVSSIDSNADSLSLEEAECYIAPSLTKNDEKLVKAMDKANRYTGLTITYDFGSRMEILDSSTLHQWVTIDDNYKVTLDTEKIKEYVRYLNYHYTTFGIARSFTKHNGKTITVKGGDYGWWINRSAEAEELEKVIKAGEDVTREPVYYQTAASREVDDIGDTYIEISLSKQHLWLFVDGEEVMDSKIVTGNLSRNYGTPKGVYSITYKEREATLEGENYSSPVNYWMPFNGNIGLHDASWRNKFGGDIYKKSGSHGCVNMPPKKAKKLYENIQKGTPVIVY